MNDSRLYPSKEYIAEREQQFVAWFKAKYKSEPDYRDVEKRYSQFERDEAREHAMNKAPR